MLRLFKNEVVRAINKFPPGLRGIFTESDLSALPEPVQRYFLKCGWIGKPKMTNVSFHISDMHLKLDLNKDFMHVKSFQFNAIEEPTRIAYLRTAMAGIVPFSGRDKYQDGEGNMLIKVMNLFTVVNAKGAELNQSALVTVLAECFLAPAYALQPYIKWHTSDANTAQATISWNHTNASGTFHFDDAGELVRFETTDRYMSLKNGVQKRTKWVAAYGGYKEMDGVFLPTAMSAFWEIDGKLIEYAKMKISDVRYDVRSIEELLNWEKKEFA